MTAVSPATVTSYSTDAVSEAEVTRRGDGNADLDACSRRLVRRALARGLVLGAVPYFLVLWDFGFRPLRTANPQRFASNFYDVQARRLLDGHLSVPTGSLGIEGFVIDGRTHMYFPPFPALLRIPVLLVTDRFDGRLTALSMTLAWLVLAAATASLIVRLRSILRGDEPVSRSECVVYTLTLAAVLGGSPIVYLASQPFVYHEVYAWAAALSVGAVSAVVGVARRPTVRGVIVAATCCLGANLTRTTAGWAMSVMTMAVAVWVWRTTDRSRRWALAGGVFLAGLVPLLTGIAVNLAKFRHPWMFPLDRQVWTMVSPQRRLALMINGGRLDGLRFTPTAVINYFRPDGIRLVPYFPFVTFPAEPAQGHFHTTLDQRYRTGSVPAFATFLFCLSVFGGWVLVRCGKRPTIWAVRIATLGAVAVSGGVMAYGYVAYRYTSDLVPALTVTAAAGAVELGRRLTRSSRRWKSAVVIVSAGAALCGAIANGAVGLHAERVAWRGQGLVEYIGIQRRISRFTGHPQERLVEFVDQLPRDAPADELAIVGDCHALFLATGDLYEPWVRVESRPMNVEIRRVGEVTPGVFRLLTIDGQNRINVTLETQDDRVRLRVGEGVYFLPTQWIRWPASGNITFELTADTSLDRFELALGGRPAGHVAANRWDSWWRMVMSTPRFDLPADDAQARGGIALTAEWGSVPRSCEQLRAGRPH